jgi:chromate transporter
MTVSEAQAEAEPTGPVSLVTLTWAFLAIGSTAYGGHGSALAMIEREFVARRRVMTADELAGALAATRLLPGPTVVQLAAYVGYTLGGWTGSALASSAFLLPSVLAMLVLAVFYERVATSPAAGPLLAGLSSAVVGLIAATGYRVGRSTLLRPRAAGLAIAAFAAGAGLGVNAAAVVVVAGLVGIPLLGAEGGGPAPGRRR